MSTRRAIERLRAVRLPTPPRLLPVSWEALAESTAALVAQFAQQRRGARPGHYGHVVELPAEKPARRMAAAHGTEPEARAFVRQRMNAYFHTITVAHGVPSSRIPDLCAWWRLDALDSPQQADEMTNNGLRLYRTSAKKIVANVESQLSAAAAAGTKGKAKAAKRNAPALVPLQQGRSFFAVDDFRRLQLPADARPADDTIAAVVAGEEQGIASLTARNGLAAGGLSISGHDSVSHARAMAVMLDFMAQCRTAHEVHAGATPKRDPQFAVGGAYDDADDSPEARDTYHDAMARHTGGSAITRAGEPARR
jgi:hypothetical protein